MIKAAIIDDDAMSRKILKNFISKSDKLECVGEFENPLVALEELGKLDCDLIFLDMEMPEMTGIEFIAAVPNIPQVIVVSSKKEYAADTYNYDVSDYLVKPVDYSRFELAIAKAEEMNSSVKADGDKADHLFIKKNKGYSRVRFEDIEFIEALADYVQINSLKEKFTVLSTMKSIALRLPSTKFLRIHRSYIVSLDKIDRIDDNLVVIGDKSLPISRSYKEELMKNLNLL
ncbi:MAG: DNA-binding LytR/AlgR family response regulator [Arenicella sp.]|jgi:DNA-binding LytR/AlgR family response regulator